MRHNHQSRHGCPPPIACVPKEKIMQLLLSICRVFNCKTINLTDGGTRMITNVLASNNEIFKVQVWEPYAEKLSGLLADSLSIFKFICSGTRKYHLWKHRIFIKLSWWIYCEKIVRESKNTKKVLTIQDTI